MSANNLLDNALLHKLDRLALVSRRRQAGYGKGERRSAHKGTSLEFVDYRPYAPGDDPRQVDWNAYGRTSNLFVKVFEEEEMLTAHVLLDVSRSMDWGQPNKLEYGRRLAAAIGYVILSGFDRLAAGLVGDGKATEHFGPVSGRRHASQLFAFLADVKPRGQTNFDAAIGRYLETRRAPGLAILISDLLSPTSEAGIKRLVAVRSEVVVLHLLAPQELEPPASEGLRLVDREDGRTIEVYLDQRAIDLYQERLNQWCGSLQTLCSRHGVRYQRLDSAVELESTIFSILRHGGVLR